MNLLSVVMQCFVFVMCFHYKFRISGHGEKSNKVLLEHGSFTDFTEERET